MDATNNDGQKLPMFTPKTADGSQRVIKQIMVIDPNKLRVAGLDVKLAEALKKAQARSTPTPQTNKNLSKDDKLALAKSILNKKLKLAQMKIDPSKDQDTSSGLQTMDQASLSPIISKPIAPGIVPTNKPQTMVLNILRPMASSLEISLKNPTPVAGSKPEHSFISKASVRETKESKTATQTNFEIKIVPPEFEHTLIPKASIREKKETKQIETQKNIESKIISSEVRFEMKKRPQAVDKPILPRSSSAKIIESKVLSPEEKINVNILRGRYSTQVVPATVPVAISKQKVIHHKPLMDSSPVQSVKEDSVIRIIPKVEPQPHPLVQLVDVSSSVQTPEHTQAIKQESAVDFISNLFCKIDERSMDDSASQTHVQSKKEPEEDATSFLMSLFALPPSVTSVSEKNAEEGTTEVLIPLPSDERADQNVNNAESKPESRGMQKVYEKEYTKTRVIKDYRGRKPAPNQETGSIKKEKNKIDQMPASSEHKIPVINVEEKPLLPTEVTQISNLAAGPSFEISFLADDFLSDVQNTNSIADTELPALPNEEEDPNKNRPLVECSAERLIEINKSPSKVKPKAEDGSTSTVPSATRRKGKKSVPVLITKLNRSRKTPASQQKVPEKIIRTPVQEKLANNTIQTPLQEKVPNKIIEVPVEEKLLNKAIYTPLQEKLPEKINPARTKTPASESQDQSQEVQSVSGDDRNDDSFVMSSMSGQIESGIDRTEESGTSAAKVEQQDQLRTSKEEKSGKPTPTASPRKKSSLSSIKLAPLDQSLVRESLEMTAETTAEQPTAKASPRKKNILSSIKQEAIYIRPVGESAETITNAAMTTEMSIKMTAETTAEDTTVATAETGAGKGSVTRRSHRASWTKTLETAEHASDKAATDKVVESRQEAQRTNDDITQAKESVIENTPTSSRSRKKGAIMPSSTAKSQPPENITKETDRDQEDQNHLEAKNTTLDSEISPMSEEMNTNMKNEVKSEKLVSETRRRRNITPKGLPKSTKKSSKEETVCESTTEAPSTPPSSNEQILKQDESATLEPSVLETSALALSIPESPALDPSTTIVSSQSNRRKTKSTVNEESWPAVECDAAQTPMHPKPRTSRRSAARKDLKSPEPQTNDADKFDANAPLVEGEEHSSKVPTVAEKDDGKKTSEAVTPVLPLKKTRNLPQSKKVDDPKPAEETILSEKSPTDVVETKSAAPAIVSIETPSDSNKPDSTNQPKRPSRWRKGKVNLVERKKTAAKTTEAKEERTTEGSSLDTSSHQPISSAVSDSPKIPSESTSHSVKAIDQPAVEPTKPSLFSIKDTSPKQGEPKNPFRKVKPVESNQENTSIEKNETKSVGNGEAGFLGFNEKEIEEGQQSASLRLSQSEEIETLQLKSPSTSGGKKKNSPVKKTALSSGKKQKEDQKNWQKSSAASLKNWLVTPDTELQNANDTTKTPLETSTDVISPNKSVMSLQEYVNNLGKSSPPEQIDAPSKSKVELLIKTETTISGTSKRKKTPAKNSPPDENPTQEATPTTSRKKGGKPTAAKTESPSTPAARKRSTKASSNQKQIKTEPGTEEVSTCVLHAKTPARKRSRSVLDSTIDLEPPAKRRSRKVETETSSPRVTKSSYVPVSTVNPTERKYKNDTEFNPRLLLIRRKEDLKSDQPLVDPDIQRERKSKDDVQCALCMGFTPKNKWTQHISEHYGIGWTVGSPPPLNIKSRASVLNFMVEFFKSSKVKGLNCRICQGQRRSGLGLLVHLEQCCLNEDELKESRIICEHCKNNYSRTSISSHLRVCAVLHSKIRLQDQESRTKAATVDAAQEDVLSNTGRQKRKSVIKAENKFKSLNDSEFTPDELIKHIPTPRKDVFTSNWLHEIQTFGKGFCVQKKCPFTATTVEELFKHCKENVCMYHVEPGYWCMKCKFRDNAIEKVRAHIISKHYPKQSHDFEDSGDDAEIESESSLNSGSSGEDENEDGNEERQKSKKKKRLKRTKKTSSAPQKNVPREVKRLVPQREQDIATLVGRWYDIFIQGNFTTSALFSFAQPEAYPTYVDGCESYFPKSPISMKFLMNGFNGFVKELGKTIVEPGQWQYLERMRGTALPTEHITYVGGPVKSIAWVPLEPHPESPIQYLASVTRKGIDKFTRYLQPKQSRSVVYIHKYCDEESVDLHSEIHYALAIDVGPVHCIEFMPSGGYAPSLNRLGLIAVGTIETDIKIYSLPLEVQKRACDTFPFLKIEPSFVLCLEIGEDNEDTETYQSQCMDIVWSKSAGHNYIIAGYLNGFIGIWDISDDSENLNRFVVNGIRKFVPVAYFWTNEDRINQIAAHYDMDGFRWLVVCNSPRRLVIYDLRDLNRPTVCYEDTTKNFCSSVDWPVVWENPSYGVGDVMPSHGCCINTVSPLSVVFGSRRFDKFCCGVNDINFNAWRNIYAAGANNGDIHMTSLREANLDVGLRLKYDEKVISTLDIVSLDGGDIIQKTSQKQPDGWRLFETDYKDKYGVVFGTTQKIMGSKKPELYGSKRIPPLNLMRLMRVNRLQYNPNRNSNSLLAVGYDNGFLRVLRSDLLNASK